MGLLTDDLTVTAAEPGHFKANISRDWEMWGPLGGYVAALALRSVSHVSTFVRPITLACNFLHSATFDEVDIRVSALRSGRTASAHRAVVEQGEHTVLEATVWSANVGQGPEHKDIEPPEVPPPNEARELREELAWLPFAKNLCVRATLPEPGDDGSAHGPPRWQGWAGFRPDLMVDDPWMDAARSVILLDISGFSASAMLHGIDVPYIAPSLDLYVSFHKEALDDEWLLMDSHAPMSTDGVLSWRGNIWTVDGRLTASGCGQSLWRKA